MTYETTSFIICTKPQAKMLAFSFEAQTQRVKDVFTFYPSFYFFFHSSSHAALAVFDLLL